MFKFQEGEVVAINESVPSLGLEAGDLGVIWVFYKGTPPLYEVTFRDAGGELFDMTVSEQEVTSTGRFAAIFDGVPAKPERAKALA